MDYRTTPGDILSLGIAKSHGIFHWGKGGQSRPRARQVKPANQDEETQRSGWVGKKKDEAAT